MQLRFFLGMSFSAGMFYAGIINVIFVLWMMQLTGNTVYTSRHFNYTNRIFNDDGSANFILIFMLVVVNLYCEHEFGKVAINFPRRVLLPFGPVFFCVRVSCSCTDV